MRLSKWIEKKIDKAQTCDECGCNATPPWCWSCTAEDCECTPGVGVDGRGDR